MFITPFKFAMKDKVCHVSTRVVGTIEGIRQDHIRDRCLVPGSSGRGLVMKESSNRQEVLVRFDDGSVSWTDSAKLRFCQ